MKKILSLMALLCSFAATAQVGQEYFAEGLKDHKDKNYKAAIKDYSKAIKANPQYRDAYYNRASCEAALKDYEAAFADYTKTIEIDPKYAKAYFGRANVYINQDKHQEALPDLDKTIELDYKLPNALTTRGQIKGEAGDRRGACMDFARARSIGDKDADQLIADNCGKK